MNEGRRPPRDSGGPRGRRGGAGGGARGPGRTPGGRSSGRHELERLLSKAGFCSRAQARELVLAGRVRVNGVVIVDPEAWFDLVRDAVVVDGRAIAPARTEGRRYLALHKPRGCVTTRSDPDGRATVYDLVADCGAWVVPVGRLDLDTSGLLLFTNDTQFADRVTSPDSHVPKTYLVEAEPRLAQEALDALARGIELADGPTRPAEVELLGHRGPRTRFLLTITEGRNRQVRRMVKAVGAKVERLERVSIGPLELGELERGRWRELEPREVAALSRAADEARPARKGTKSGPGGARA
ncbi:MAG: rRNA pseudouridine synthase [Planctomycetes bacterium]|nr:rRNA pseudouridine synthase [Planctomycetota bacterium]